MYGGRSLPRFHISGDVPASTDRMAGVTTSTSPSGIRLDFDGPLARITLDRPEVHNALEASDIADFRAALDRCELQSGVRVLVLTGRGDQTFSSGASLGQMQSGALTGDVFETLTNRLAEVRLPTVCALNGSVYGGGAEIALCCDFRIGVKGSRLSVPAAALGVCYPLGGLRRYVQRLGPTVASRILLAAEEFSADEMFRVGFLTHLVDAGELTREADALAMRLASLAPLAVQGMKRLLTQVAAGTIAPSEAAGIVTHCAESADLIEGLKARKEGRPPVFEGR